MLSNSVEKCLESQQLDHTASTRELIAYMNKFFDCLNVKSRNEGARKKNVNLFPYRSNDDIRLKVKNLFLVLGTKIKKKRRKLYTGKLSYYGRTEGNN